MFDFAYFLLAEPQAMVVPRPREEPRLFAFIDLSNQRYEIVIEL
jgi:hypothetical protein